MNNPHFLQPLPNAASTAEPAQANINPLARIVIKDVDPKSAFFTRYGRRLDDRGPKQVSRTPYLRYVG